jgi:hypothetical protein
LEDVDELVVLDAELESEVELVLPSDPEELLSPDSLLWAFLRASEG